MERLQKVLAHAGIASRRKCEELILAKRVRVNGRIVAELGTKVDELSDSIEVDGTRVEAEKKVTILLHKPKGYLSDVESDVGSNPSPSVRGKPFAVDLVPVRARLYPAGRLDANSEGLLLLTNDGELAHRVTHPRFRHEKEYLALVQGEPIDEDLVRMKSGIWYEGDRLRADTARIVRHLGPIALQHNWAPARRGETWLRLILHEGKKREVRHLCGALGFPVLRLVRIRIGPIELGALPVGEWRTLDEREVRELKSGNRQRKTQTDAIDQNGRLGDRHRRAGSVRQEHHRGPPR